MLTGTTNRRVGGQPPGGPVRHAVLDSMPKRTRTGRMLRALCGAGVEFHSGPGFDVRHPRACRECVRQARPRLAREAGR